MSDSFLKSLRAECLKDPDDLIGQMRTIFSGLGSDPVIKLTSGIKLAHTLKGNLQSVGFVYCSQYVDQFETHVERIIETGSELSDDDIGMVEFMLSDFVTNLEDYLTHLAKNPEQEDSQNLALARNMPLSLLAEWKPAQPGPVVEQSELDKMAPIGAVSEISTLSGPERDISAELSGIAAKYENQDETSEEIEPNDDDVGGENFKVEVNPATRAPLVEIGPSRFLFCKKMGADGPSYFAVDVKYVVEIVQVGEVSPLPFPREKILGLLNLRGEPITILRTPDFLDRDKIESGRQHIVIAKVKDIIFGFCVEEAETIHLLDPREFQSPDGIFDKTGRSWITNITKFEDRTILIVDLRRAAGIGDT